MKKHEKSAVFDFVIVIILLIFIGFIVFMKVDNYVYKVRDERSLEDFSKAWHTDSGEDISLEKIGSSAVKNGMGQLEIDIYHTIPAYLVGDTILNFRSKNIRFQAVIDNEVVYEFMPAEQQVLSKGIGSTFHRINISTEDAGREIELKILPVYNDKSSCITSMFLGRTWDYFGMILDQRFWEYQFSIIVAFVGIILIIMSSFSKLDGGHNERSRILGIFTICISAWVNSETLMPQFMFGYSTQFNEINHLLLIFMPYFFMSYIYQDLVYCKDILLKISFYITAINLVLISVLSFAGIMDSHESLFIVHIGIITTILISFYAIFYNMYYCKKNKIKYNTVTIIFSIAIFIFTVLWDMASYYLNYVDRDNGSAMKYGILIGILILAIDSLRKLFEGIKKIEITNKVSEIECYDSLTGLANRNAFEIKGKDIQEKIDSGIIDEFIVCKFDINNIREVNDNYGHAYGDRHIIKCAEIINQAFGKSGHTFRVDGDEFAAFVIGSGTEYIYERGILKLKELEREYNRTIEADMKLHIAYGYVRYDKDKYGSVEKAEAGADKNMCECKAMMKKGAIV